MISSSHSPIQTIMVEVEPGCSRRAVTFVQHGLDRWSNRLPPKLQQYRNLASAFLDIAQHMADRPMWIDHNRTLTYGWFRTAAFDVCDRLIHDSNFRPGNRVILRHVNSPEYLASFYGVLLAAGVVVPVPPAVEEELFEEILRQTSASHILTHSIEAGEETDEFEKLSIGNTWAATANPPSLTVSDELNAQLPDLALILYTSGSAGEPKGVMLSHTNLLSNAVAIRDYLALTPQDRPLCLLPFQYAFGNSIVQSHVLSGACLIHGGSPLFPQTILAAVSHHRATSISGVPSLFELLFQKTNTTTWGFPDLRYLAVAGGALHPDLATRVAKTIAPKKLFVMYGQTEATARLAYLPPEEVTHRPNSIGKAIPGVTLEVVDENGNPAPPHVPGELRARGPNIMMGYWRDPMETHKVLRDQWLYTGDIATVDDEGWIAIVGRRNHWVKIAGNRVHPREIERFVVSHCDVDMAVVVPFQESTGATRLALFIVGENACKKTIAADCRRHLASFKVPSVVKKLDVLPRMASAKVDRRRLSGLAASEFNALATNSHRDRLLEKHHEY